MEDGALGFKKKSREQGQQEGLLGIICLCKSLEIMPRSSLNKLDFCRVFSINTFLLWHV